METVGLGVTHTVEGTVRIVLLNEELNSLGVEVFYSPEEAIQLATAIIRNAHLATTIKE